MKVKLTYFKLSGKYYSEGEYESEKVKEYEAIQEVRSMHNRGIHPGLVDGSFEFVVLAEFPSGVPHLFL